MGNLAIGVQNLFSLYTPTLSGGSWSTADPLAKLLTRTRADVARSSDALAASTKIRIDWGSARSARVLALLGHNLTSAATVRWMRGTSAGGVEVADSTALNAWQFTPLSYDGQVYMVSVVQASANSARHDTIEIVDTANPAGYVEIARLWIGTVFVPEVNAELGLKSTARDLSTKERTEGGTPVVIRRPILQGETFVLGSLSLAEGRTLRQMQMWAGVTEEVYYSPDIADPAATQADGFVGTFDDLGPVEYAQLARRGVPVALTRD